MVQKLKTIIKKYNIKPSKKLGQNFLIDKKVLKKIIAAAELKKDDIVLEIGPGLGILTLELAKNVKKVVAIEKDKNMVKILKNILKENNIKNVVVIEGDVRKIDIAALLYQQNKTNMTSQKNFYKLVANIPYYLTSPLMKKFLEAEQPPQTIILMIQKEVAQRICAQPPKMNLLATATQFYALPKTIFYVSRKSFWPQPKVNSATIKILPFKTNPALIPPQLEKIKQIQDNKIFINDFFRLVRAGFSQPRKQIINNLTKNLFGGRQKTAELLKKANINPTQRSGEIPVDKWLDLTWIACGK